MLRIFASLAELLEDNDDSSIATGNGWNRYAI